jgi:hypothetical protein
MTPENAVSIIHDIILNRKGELITEELAMERARNATTALEVDSTHDTAQEMLEALRLAAAALEEGVDPGFREAVYQSIMAILAKTEGTNGNFD